MVLAIMLSLLVNKDYHTQLHNYLISFLDILIPHNSIFPHPPAEVTLSIHHSFGYSPLPGGGWQGEKLRLGKIPQPETLKQQVGGRREGDRERGNIRSGDYIKQSRRMGRRGGSMEMRVVSGMGQGGVLSRSSGAGVDNVVTGAATCGVSGHVPPVPGYLDLTILWGHYQDVQIYNP